MAETKVKTDTTETTAPAAKPAKAKTADNAYWTVGRRKEAVARIKLALGQGSITINDKPIEEAYASPIQKSLIMAPLVAVERQAAFDISIKVAGGGQRAQLDAISLGIARALKEYDETLRPILKAQSLLTRDSRMKERKKYGLKRARKAPQFSKR
jgi:small subunit ribosomal protein S9